MWVFSEGKRAGNYGGVLERSELVINCALSGYW